MRRSFTSNCLLTFTVILLVSWGKIGHQAIGNIAAAHLTPKTVQAIAGLLGKETLADVSTYADEIREDSFLQSTGPWHYIDVPANENFDQFKVSVYGQTTPNLYKALLHFERELQDPRTNRPVKIFALKMLVHLVEDAHQPLHVARAEDKGGNIVAVKFEGEETNLHALWDSKLIEHTRLSATQLAKDWDFATPEDIKVWQADPLIGWLYESNHISNHIYQELPASRDLGESYYTKYIPLVRQRIDQAGIRLAGILNQCFDSPAAALNTSDTTICDKVYDGKYLEGSQITFLNVGGAYPSQKFSVVIKGSDRDKFKAAPEKMFAGKTICVTGSITMYKGRPEIVVNDPKQIVVKN
jgi:hypothetical protein